MHVLMLVAGAAPAVLAGAAPAVAAPAPPAPANALHLEAGGPFFTGGLQYERRVAPAWLVRGGYGLVPLDLRDTEAPVHVLTVGGGWAPPVGRRGLEATLGATVLTDGSEALAQPALFLGFRDQRAAALVWRLGFTLRPVPWPTASLGWAF